MKRYGLALAGVLIDFAAACSSTPALTAATPSVTPSPAATKPASTQEPLPAATYVRFAIDRGTDAARPYFLVLIYDGVATNFRVLDASGQVVLRVPIAGSGIFSAETCAVRARPPGKAEGFTYMSVDTETTTSPPAGDLSRELR